jgi:hypothetical protein
MIATKYLGSQMVSRTPGCVLNANKSVIRNRSRLCRIGGTRGPTVDTRSTRMTQGGHWPARIPQRKGLLQRCELKSSTRRRPVDLEQFSEVKRL